MLSIRQTLERITAAMAVVIIWSTAAGTAWAHTVGYVDTAKVLTSYKAARDAQGKMQVELTKYQQAFAERQKKIAEAQKAGKTQEELQKMTQAFELELKPLKDKAMNLEAKLAADVKTKIEAVIKTVAAKRKVDLVLDKAAVLHGGVDLTSDVVKQLK
ncbi:MAG: OmpH family outer membrane protein [Candidatus Sericytochromatia bacterium]|nr:OmpH family outer membrane protein [Candidatus Sericytochromatia bacterium]